MEAIKIPDELLNEFKEPPKQNGDAEQQEFQQETAMQGIDNFLNWIVETADNQAKQMGYPGTGQVPPQQLAELYAIVAKRNLSEAMLQKTPEAMAISLTLGIVGVNMAAHRKQKIEQQKQQAEDE